MDLQRLRSVELRAVDKGTLRGKFEVFFGFEKLPLETDITWELYEGFNKRAARLALKKGLGTGQESKDLDNLFETFFNVKLTPGNHITLGMCGGWRKKHYQFLLDILQARSLPGPCSDNDSS